MEMRKNRRYFGLLFLTCRLVAWSSVSYSSDGGDAYWQNKHWYGMLLGAVQSVLHYPTDAAGRPVQPVPEMVTATVGFIYADGRISDPSIIKSSGRSDLDAAFLAQVVTAQPPRASGSHAAEPHTFRLVFKMRTPMQDFETDICEAFDAKWRWPKDLILAGELRPAVIDFTYFNDKVSDIKLVTSSGSTVMDKTYVRVMSEAQMPPPPAWLPPHALPLKATLDEELGEPVPMCVRSKVRLRTPGTSQAGQAASQPLGP